MTTKKDVFQIQSYPIGWQVNAQKEVEAYYAQQKQEYMRKWGLKKLKQGKTYTALEAWNS